MSQYLFGLGKGHLSDSADEIAKRHGARLVNHTDPGCGCGHGCRGDCPARARHWFECPNKGAPFDKQTADAVMADLAKAVRNDD